MMKTLDEVIKAFETCVGTAIGQPCSQCPYFETCGDDEGKADALHYLKEFQLAQNLRELGNDPLDWDELRQMVGKPVWVEEKYSFSDEWHGGWEVICSVWDDEWDDDPYLSMTDEEYRHKDDMGERWQAYRKERTE